MTSPQLHVEVVHWPIWIAFEGGADFDDFDRRKDVALLGLY